MSFLKSLFKLDTASHLARGDEYASSEEWGLAHMEYEKALLAIDSDSKALTAVVGEKLGKAAEKVYEKNRSRAAAALDAGDLPEALAFESGALEVLSADDPRRTDISARIDELKVKIDEASLKEEIAAFLEGQGTAEFARQRRQWEFSMYFINPSDVDLDDSEKFTTLDLIELAGDLEENPDDPDRLVNFGMALAQSGFARRAIAPLCKAAELRPDDKEVHYLLGNLYADEGDLDMAVSSFEKAIELDPRFSLAYLYLARTYLKAEDDEEAARLLRRAVETASGDSGVAEEAKELLGQVRNRQRSLPPDEPESLEDRIP